MPKQQHVKTAIIQLDLSPKLIQIAALTSSCIQNSATHNINLDINQVGLLSFWICCGFDCCHFGFVAVLTSISNKPMSQGVSSDDLQFANISPKLRLQD